MAENNENTKNFWEKIKANGEHGKENIKEFGKKVADNAKSFGESVKNDGFPRTLGNGAVGIAESLKNLAVKMIKGAVAGIKHIVKKFADNKEIARKLGVLQEELENLEDVMERNNEMSAERMAAMVDCISRLNDRVADFSPDNIDKFIEGVRSNLSDAYDVLGETFVLRTNQIQEALDTAIPRMHQEEYKAYVVPEQGTGALKAVLSVGEGSNQTTFAIEREGNYCKFRAMQEEELQKLDFGHVKVEKGNLLAEKVKKAYEECYGDSRTEAQKRIDDCKKLINALTATGENVIEQNGYKFQYNKEQQRFISEQEDGSRLMLDATATSLTAYFQENADSNPVTAFVINREEKENGKIESLHAMKVPLNLTEKVNEFLSIPEVNIVLRAYNGEKLPEELKQSNNGKFTNIDKSGSTRMTNLYNRLYNTDGILTRSIGQKEKNPQISVRLDGEKDEFLLSFTPDGKHIGYDYIDSSGNSTIISKSGGIIDAVTAESENFKKLYEIVNNVMQQVNQKIDDLQNMTEEEKENLSETQKQLMNAEKFNAPSFEEAFKIRQGVYLLMNAEKEKKIDERYDETSLRAELGDKFDSALKDMKQVIYSFEALTTSPDGETEGWYREMRGMPENQRQELGENAGEILKNGIESLKNHHQLIADEKIRAMVAIAYNQVFQDNESHQILNRESFATAYMEAAHDVLDGKNTAEIGSRMIEDIIRIQNIAYQRDDSIDYVDTPFNEEEQREQEELFERNMEEDRILSSPQSEARFEVINNLLSAISEGRLAPNAVYTELETAILEKLEVNGMINGFNGSYELTADMEQIGRTMNEFVIENKDIELSNALVGNDLMDEFLIKSKLERSYHEIVSSLYAGTADFNNETVKTVDRFVQQNADISFATEEDIQAMSNRFAEQYCKSEFGINMSSPNVRNAFKTPDFETAPPVPVMSENREPALMVLAEEDKPVYAAVMLEQLLLKPDTKDMELTMFINGYMDYQFDEEIYKSAQKFAEDFNLHYENGKPVIESNGKVFDMEDFTCREAALRIFIENQFGSSALKEACIHVTSFEIPLPTVKEKQQPVETKQEKPVQEQTEPEKPVLKTKEYEKLKPYVEAAAEAFIVSYSYMSETIARGKASSALENYNPDMHHRRSVEDKELVFELQDFIVDYINSSTLSIEDYVTSDQTLTEKGKDLAAEFTGRYFEEHYRIPETPQKETKSAPESPEMD